MLATLFLILAPIGIVCFFAVLARRVRAREEEEQMMSRLARYAGPNR